MPDAFLRTVRVVAADIDDTITLGGKIPAETPTAFAALEARGVLVVLVTGRPAGWVQALANYLPGVALAIGENGMVMFEASGARRDLGVEARATVAPAILEQGAERLRVRFGLNSTGDDAFRLFERTLERPADFGQDAVVECQTLVDPSCEVLASSIHLHVRPRGWGKAEGLRAALATRDLCPGKLADAPVVFIGDSANDRSLFGALPDASVGVRNVTRFLSELGGDRPRYITDGEGAAGFVELAGRILAVPSAAAR